VRFSTDPKFEKMLQYVQQCQTEAEIGILGFHPQTGGPLRTGVVCKIPYYFTNPKTGSVSGITYGLSARNKDRVVATSFKATSTLFHIVGDPWMDPTNSFFLAHVETLDGRYEICLESQHNHAEQLFAQIPTLVEEWKSLMFATDWCTPAALSKKHQLSEIGTVIPQTSHRDRAMWVAALLNPVGLSVQQQQHQQQPPSLTLNSNNRDQIMKSTCPDIRPLMLLCRNDYDRLVLAVSALQASNDFLRKYRQQQQQRL
jgi:hypothetical protein